MVELEQPRDQHRQRKPDPHPDAVVQDDRVWRQMGAHGLRDTQDVASRPGAERSRGLQWSPVRRRAACRDDRVAAERQRQIRDDVERVVRVQSLQHLLWRRA